MYYVRTTGGSMMAITPKSKTVISLNKKTKTEAVGRDKKTKSSVKQKHQ